MAERLPKGTFDQLGRHIWKIGQLGLRNEIEVAPMPSLVSKPFSFGRHTLDLAIELIEDPIMGIKVPQWLSAKITESVPYEPNTKFDLRTVKVLDLNLSERSKTYYTEIEIGGEDDAVITPLVGPPGHRAVVAPDAWKNISRRSLTAFGPAEAEYFLTHLATFAERLKQDL